MKKFILVFIIGLTSIFSIDAQYSYWDTPITSSYSSQPLAFISFKNSSAYTLTLRIVYVQGGYYNTVVLRPYSSSKVTFSKSGNFKLKIKAISSDNHVSYHDGGKFSVTCTDNEWTEGEMSFQMSSYGNGLGPSISAKQFESDY